MAESVLLVDNDLSLAQTIAAVLESRGIPTEHCSSARGAIELLQLRSFPLVIIDVILGDDTASGIYVIDEIRRLPKKQRPLVLVISGSGVEKLRGVDRRVVAAILLKPLDLELFAKQVVATWQHVTAGKPRRVVQRPQMKLKVARSPRTFCGSCDTEIPPWATEMPKKTPLDANGAFEVWLDMPCRSCGKAPREAGGRSEL